MFIPRLGPGALFFLSLSWIFLAPVAATIVNRTIDDTFGDSQTGQLVTYLPATVGVWEDETCAGCAIRPSVLQAFKNTYTAATYNPGLENMNITMQFNGTAIYVFFILANNAGDGITTLTLANFTLDGNPPQLFQHAPDLTTTDILFNQLAFAQTNLINAPHTLVISTSGVDTNVYVNFDYAIYTHDDAVLPSSTPGSSSSTGSPPASSSSITAVSSSSSTTTANSLSSSTNAAAPTTSNNSSVSGTQLGSTADAKKSTPTAAIAGGIVGGLVVLVVLALLLVLCLRRRKTLSRESMEARGYVPPLMMELSTPLEHPSTSVDPFTTPPRSQHSGFENARPGYGAGLHASTSEMLIASRSNAPMSSESAYGGYVEPSLNNALQNSSANDSAASGSGLTYLGSSQAPLRSVTIGDHLSSPHTDGPLSSSSILNSYGKQPASTNVEDIRRARQNELDQRLRDVQEEMAFLSSDITGEKSGRHRSLRRQRTVNRDQQAAIGGEGEGEDEEMTMEEMRDQLRQVKDQIAFLREQQRSAWAQGLSDDPPPGYTPASSTSRYSGPPQTAFS
jgi:hypothetical protein